MDSLSQEPREAVAALSVPETEADGTLDSGGQRWTARDRAGQRRVRALLRRPTFVVSALIVVFWVVAAVGWHLFGLDPYGNSGHALAGPGWSHPFGTDNLGRSVFARTLAGADTALAVGPLGTVLATVLGGALGVIAGYFRGWVDTALMRVFDLLAVLPPLIFLIILVGECCQLRNKILPLPRQGESLCTTVVRIRIANDQRFSDQPICQLGDCAARHPDFIRETARRRRGFSIERPHHNPLGDRHALRIKLGRKSVGDVVRNGAQPKSEMRRQIRNARG